MLTSAFNYVFNNGEVPESFQKSIIFPIFKKGDPDCPSNYRGIAFLNAETKVLTGILLERLTKWAQMNHILTEHQSGFRKGYSTVDNIFCIDSMAKLMIHKGRKLYCFFIDLKAAFDLIVRTLLFSKLSHLGVSTKFLKVLESLYANNTAVVWDGNDTSKPFTTSIGVKQGCLLSPLLFSLFLNDLPNAVSGGITINGININALMYADDIVLVAETPEALQRMINRMVDYCNKWSLTINIDKSKILIFQKHTRRRKREEKWSIGSTEIEVVKNYKYLGVWFSPSGNFKDHLKQKLVAARTAICSTWRQLLSNRKILHSSKYKIYEATVRTIMFYAAQVWGATSKNYNGSL